VTVTTTEFEHFVSTEGARLRRAVIARFGVDVGGEITADALAHAWAHWDELRAMANPTGYLYRVAQSAARRHVRWSQRRVSFPRERGIAPDQPDLFDALARLSDAQRVAVVLVHAHGYSYAETAEVLGVSVAAVTNHVHRGLRRLRSLLEEDT
jgi:RNA polymerase sigma-70 factor (ECF subfamily)